MALLQKDALGQLCITASATHIASDLVNALFPTSHHLHLLHTLEPGLLLLATLALAVHLTLERAMFDCMIAAAHGGNLLVAWVNAAFEWTFRGAGVELPGWIGIIAGPVLGIAVVATLIEVLDLRHKSARMLLAGALAVLGLCCVDGEYINQFMPMPPRARVERNMVVFTV